LLCDTEVYITHFSIYAVTTLLKMKCVWLLTAIFLQYQVPLHDWVRTSIFNEWVVKNYFIILTENDKIAK